MMLATGCARKVNVSMVQPASVGLPDDVQKVIVINNAGGGSSYESHATGEGRFTDRRGSQVAVEALVDQLESSQQYDVVSFTVGGSSRQVPMVRGEPDWKAIEKMCRNERCDAVIVLERFDSDIYTEVERDHHRGEPRHRADFDAERSASVEATFAVYDADGDRQILDHDRSQAAKTDFEYNEPSPQEAVAELQSKDAMVHDLAVAVASDYASRIASLEVEVQRKLYSSGHAKLKKGVKKAQDGNWSRAIELWEKVVANGDRTDRGKALHNLSVAYEARGDLAAAHKAAKRADKILDRKRTSRHLAALGERLAFEGTDDAVADAE